MEWTDDTFTMPAEQNEQLGIVGPVIWAEHGDTIYVTEEQIEMRS